MKNRGSITITGLEDINRQPTVSVKIENGNVWMTKHELAGLFGVFVQTIDANMRSIFKSGILYDGDVTITERQEKDGKVCSGHYTRGFRFWRNGGIGRRATLRGW